MPTEAPSQPTAIPTYGMPRRNRRVLLARRPVGVPLAGDFTLDESAVPEPADGEFLVRNIYLSVDPAQRGWASTEGNYSDAIKLGSVMRALAVGVVVKSRASGVTEGEFLYGWFGWQDYATARPEHIANRGHYAVPLSAYGGLLGINGLTAYLALTELGRPEPGNTLLVSTAAGSVGGFVGQIGTKLGCRTIGLTSTPDKVALCRTRFGYDDALSYRGDDFEARLDAALPGGADVFFDNTGGAILDTALRRMRPRGRVVQCGTASVTNWADKPAGRRNEREVLTRRLVWSGFIVFDYAAKFAAASTTLSAWYAAGELAYQEHITDGIEGTPDAIRQLYAGENTGKRLIYIG
jgi:NADPH-dependent curcumin reductase CurA